MATPCSKSVLEPMDSSPWNNHGSHIPMKTKRRRIVCPTLKPSEAQCNLPRLGPNFDPTKSLRVKDQSLSQKSKSALFTVNVRVLYFSHDGAQADNGNVLEFEVDSCSSCGDLLQRVRNAINVGQHGKLLFKGRTLAEETATLESVGVIRDPQNLHFMLSRKYRPLEVARRAEKLAAELDAAVAATVAENNLNRVPRRRKPPRSPPSPRPVSVQSVLSA